MTEINPIRKVGTMPLPTLIYSLGLPRATFSSATNGIESPFDAVVDGGRVYPDCVWFFRGESFYRFNLLTQKFEGDLEKPQSVGEWARGWPPAFASAIDAAVWGGDRFPNLWYFFRGPDVMRVNLENSAQPVDSAPGPIATSGFQGLGCTPFAEGIDAALHGVATQDFGQIHMFKGGQCTSHDLATGALVHSPRPIAEVWHLPEPFSCGIDLAFYGTGDRDAGTVYFVKGDRCVAVDAQTRKPREPVALEARFKALGRFIPKPQILCIENYVLETFVGPVQLGNATSASLFVPPGSRKEVRMVVEAEVSSTSKIEHSVLQSQDDATTEDFRGEFRRQTGSEEEAEHSSWRLESDLEAKGSINVTSASAQGEAHLKANGGTDDFRAKFTDAAELALSSQLSRSSRKVSQTAMSASTEYKRTDKTLQDELTTIENKGSEPEFFQFYSQNQPYWVVLSLRRARIAYSDGVNDVEPVEIDALDSLLERVLAGQEADRVAARTRMLEAFRQVRDWNGVCRSLIREQGDDISFDRDLVSQVKFESGTFSAAFAVPGLVKTVTEKLIPTHTLVPVKSAAAVAA